MKTLLKLIDEEEKSMSKLLFEQERVCSLKDRLVVDFIDKMLKIFVWDDFGSIKLSTWLFGVEQFWLDFGIRAK